MAIDKAATRVRVRSIREILNKHWDPIGMFPDAEEYASDEYQSYAGKLSAMVREGVADEALLAYLSGLRPNTWVWSDSTKRAR